MTKIKDEIERKKLEDEQAQHEDDAYWQQLAPLNYALKKTLELFNN